MKEVTYEDWQKNPTPREMWVWDFEERKQQLKVIYISKEDVAYPVVTLTHSDIDLSRYKHCAEIKKQRRMTNKELARWLREKPTRECKYVYDSYVYSFYDYKETCGDEEVDKEIVIREDDGEWQEPLVEVEE